MTSAGGGSARSVGGGGCHGRAVTGRCLTDGVVENGKVRMQVVSTSLVAVENTCYKYCGMQRKINYKNNKSICSHRLSVRHPFFCGPTMSGEDAFLLMQSEGPCMI